MEDLRVMVLCEPSDIDYQRYTEIITHGLNSY